MSSSIEPVDGVVGIDVVAAGVGDELGDDAGAAAGVPGAFEEAAGDHRRPFGDALGQRCRGGVVGEPLAVQGVGPASVLVRAANRPTHSAQPCGRRLQPLDVRDHRDPSGADHVVGRVGAATCDVDVRVGRDDELRIDDEVRANDSISPAAARSARLGVTIERGVADAGDRRLDVEDVDEAVVAGRLREHRLDRHLDDRGAGEVALQRRRLGAPLDEDEGLGGVRPVRSSAPCGRRRR